ncbi:MAG: MATE family efflux transporter [Muribaculaceae bacterium]|nr:MATE family efflux transporter [Muribaculaceae bacterium]
MKRKSRNLDRDKLDFGRGNVGTLFRALFFPTLIGMIFNSVLTLVDGMFVGHGAGANGIAAVNIVAPLFMLTTGIGLMLGIGASVVASIRLSEDNVKAARIIMTQSFAAGLVLIGAIVAGALLWPRATVYALGCSPELEANALSYLRPLMPGLPFLLVQCVGMMLIRLDGSPRYAMWSQLVPATINIALDYIMIFPLGMGVAGAASATSISCGLGGIMVLAYFVCKADKLRFYRLKLSVTSLLLTMRNVGYMARIGFATFLTECAMGIMMFTGNYAFMKLQGEAGVAAYSIACFLFPVVFSIANAVAQSAQPIISYNYGAGADGRISQALRVALLTAVACGLVVTTGLWFGAGQIVSAFLSPSEPAYAIATHGVPLFATCAVFFAVNITFIGYYQSIEEAGESIVYTMLRGVVFLVPSFLTLPALLGSDGLWLAIPLAELLTLAVIISVRAWRRSRTAGK